MNQLTKYSKAPPMTALTRNTTGMGALWKRLSASVSEHGAEAVNGEKGPHSVGAVLVVAEVDHEHVCRWTRWPLRPPRR